MRSLIGHITGVNKGVVSVELETGNTRDIRTDKPFRYGEKVRVNFNYKAKTVRSIELFDEPPEGTQKCSRCCESYIEYGEDDIEDIW